MVEISSDITELLVDTLADLTISKTSRLEAITSTKINSAEIVNQLYILSIQHGVANIINGELSELLASNKYDPVLNNDELSLITELKNKLSNFAQHSRISNLIIDNSAKELLYALNKENLDVIVLKGFSLGYQVYDTPYLRPKSDVDILIKKEDKTKVTGIFKKFGYTNPRGWEPQAIINQFSMRKKLSDGVNVLFDIHLHISNSKQIEDILKHDELSKTSNKVLLPRINLVNKPYALVHAIFHLLHHKSMGDLVKLIWFYDIYLIIEQLSIDELNQLKTLVQDKGLATLIAYTLELTHLYFASTKNKELSIWCKTPELMGTSNNNYNYLMGNIAGIKGVWLTLCATEGISKKMAILREIAFPPAAEIYIKYGKSNKYPLPLLYIRRILTGSIKYIFKQKK